MLIDEIVLSQQHREAHRKPPASGPHRPHHILQADAIDGPHLGGELRLGRQLETRGETERAATSRLAVDGDRPAHQLHQAQADCQPQASAAVLARGRSIGLPESLKDHLLLRGRDADAGVGNREAQRYGALRGRPGLRLNQEFDPASHRKLDGIAQQVGQNLTQTQRIANQTVRERRLRRAFRN